MINCIIVHGSNSTKKGSKEGVPENNRHWKLWLKQELEKKGIETSNKIYPKDWNPSYNEWKNIFENNQVDENTILIGHSAGGAFLVRWIGETKKKIKKLILVSPGKVGKERKTLSDLYGDKTYKNIGKHVEDEIIVYTSNNDIPSHIIGANEYEKELPAKVIILKNHGHFTLGEMRTEEFPELLEEVLK